MVNWKNAESSERLFVALLATHPNLKLNYHAIAKAFGQGATNNSIRFQFGNYNKLAKELKPDVSLRSEGTPTKSRSNIPRTPRSQHNGITKSSTGKNKGKGKDLEAAFTTPTKKGGKTPFDVICLDENSGDEIKGEQNAMKMEVDQVKGECLNDDGSVFGRGITEFPEEMEVIAKHDPFVKEEKVKEELGEDDNVYLGAI